MKVKFVVKNRKRINRKKKIKIKKFIENELK